MAEVEVMNKAQSCNRGFVTRAAEVLVCATSPGMGSRRKFLVIAIRAMDLSW